MYLTDVEIGAFNYSREVIRSASARGAEREVENVPKSDILK